MPPHMLLISLHCRHKTAASTMLALQMYVHTPHTVLHGLVVIGCMLSGVCLITWWQCKVCMLVLLLPNVCHLQMEWKDMHVCYMCMWCL